MLFTPLDIPGLFLIELERMEDERGFSLVCSPPMRSENEGYVSTTPNGARPSTGAAARSGGLHFQVPPYEETKLVSCTRGAVFDVAVDVRPGSSSRGRWVGVELSADNRSTFYIP